MHQSSFPQIGVRKLAHHPGYRSVNFRSPDVPAGREARSALSEVGAAVWSGTEASIGSKTSAIPALSTLTPQAHADKYAALSAGGELRQSERPASKTR